MIGPQGIAGVDGSTILSGAGPPTSGIGNQGDFYIDQMTQIIYGPKTSSGWGSGTTMAGPQGPAGVDGRTILSGPAAPGAGDGNDGDFWIDTASNVLYGPKTGGAWGSGVSMIGPQGNDGPEGPKGDKGAPGTSPQKRPLVVRVSSRLVKVPRSRVITVAKVICHAETCRIGRVVPSLRIRGVGYDSRVIFSRRSFGRQKVGLIKVRIMSGRAWEKLEKGRRSGSVSLNVTVIAEGGSWITIPIRVGLRR